MVNPGHVEVVGVARGEGLPAVLACVDKGAGEVARLHVGFEVALSAAHLLAQAAPEHPRPQRLYVVVKSVQTAGAYNTLNRFVKMRQQHGCPIMGKR